MQTRCLRIILIVIQLNIMRKMSARGYQIKYAEKVNNSNLRSWKLRTQQIIRTAENDLFFMLIYSYMLFKYALL